jgi:hypothetical protein
VDARIALPDVNTERVLHGLVHSGIMPGLQCVFELGCEKMIEPSLGPHDHYEVIIDIWYRRFQSRASLRNVGV